MPAPDTVLLAASVVKLPVLPLIGLAVMPVAVNAATFVVAAVTVPVNVGLAVGARVVSTG